MNERIRELSKQAFEYTLDRLNSGLEFRDFQPIWSEKFAELIVRESVAVADDYVKDCTCEEHINCKPRQSAIGRKIREHFGVEEQEKVAPKPKCSVCGTTENVRYMGGYQPYLCDSVDCIPF